MRERVVRFGDPTELVGILTEPRSDAASTRPGVLLLNSGILHRAGASRLYVQLARSLAEAGFTALRFDYSGIGDSEVRRDSLSFEESARQETRQAMDYLEDQAECREFVLTGLCSGADMAFQVAPEDERVVGVAQIDGIPYSTWKSLVKHYAPRLFDPAQWAHSVRVRIEELLERFSPDSQEGGDAPDYITPEYRRKTPPQSEVEAALETLMDRHVELYHLFTGNYGKDYNYREQYRDAFSGVDFGDRLTVDYLPDSDHLLSDLEHQKAAVRAIREWAVRAWGGERESSRDAEEYAPEPLAAGA